MGDSHIALQRTSQTSRLQANRLKKPRRLPMIACGNRTAPLPKNGYVFLQIHPPECLQSQPRWQFNVKFQSIKSEPRRVMPVVPMRDQKSIDLPQSSAVESVSLRSLL